MGHILILAIPGLFAIWLLVPLGIFMAGVTKLRSEVFEDPRRAEPTGDDPDYQRRFRQFEALGFRPIGMTRESGWFILPLKWYWHSLQGVRWMIAADGLMLVSFHRLLASEPLRFGVVTLNSAGGLMRTTCPGAEVTLDRDSNNARFELRGVEPAELVARHRENVAAFCEERDLESKPATFPEAAAVDLAVDRLAIKKLGGGTPISRLLLLGIGLTLAYPRLRARFGHHDAAPPRPRPPHVPHHLSALQLLTLLAGPIAMAVVVLIVMPLLRRSRILRSHTEDVSGE